MMKQGVRAAAAAGILALVMVMPAYAGEEREPVGIVSLTFSSTIEAGEDGDVEVTVDSGSCSVDSVDVVNPKGYWVGGDKPKVKVELGADRGYYFDKSGKSAFQLDGAGVKYQGSNRKNDKETMILTVTLEKLEDGDLDVGGLRWDEANAVAHWDENPEAKHYKVRLCRGDTNIGSVQTTTETSFDFSDKIDRAGDYTFKVRVIDRGDNGGDWEESSQLYVTGQEAAELTGSWKQDDRGWWFQNADGSFPANNWKKVGQFWYFFGMDGYMKTGWVQWNGRSYFCDLTSGAMLVNAVTPDGFHVDGDGVRID